MNRHCTETQVGYDCGAPKQPVELVAGMKRLHAPSVLSMEEVEELERYVALRAVSDPGATAVELNEFLQNSESGGKAFSPYRTLRIFMDRDKDHRTETAIYQAAGFSRQKFSRIRSESSYRLAKIDLLSLAVVLRLGLDGTLDLLGRFGFTLSNYDKSDLIVRFFLERNDPSVVRINDALYTYGLPLLCNVVE